MLSVKHEQKVLLVEFIGVTGVGKSTLMAEVRKLLAQEGIRVLEAEDVMLARYGWALSGYPKLRSAVVHMLAVAPFCGYCLTRQGGRLSRLAFNSIMRGVSSFGDGFGLLRNFLKRIGFHLLFEQVRGEFQNCDIAICDEGVVHAAHNLFVHTGTEPRREDIALFGRIIPKPDLLIWITAPPAQSAAVIQKRGHSRVDQAPESALAFAEHAHATFEMLASVAELQNKVVRFDNRVKEGVPSDVMIGTRAAALAELLKKRLAFEREAQRSNGVYPMKNGTHE